jgi:iron complex outermembrane receptor protein
MYTYPRPFPSTHIFVVLLTLMVSLPMYAQEDLPELFLDTVNIRSDRQERKVFIPVYQVTSNELRFISTRDLGDYLRSIPNVGGIRKGGAAIDPVVRGYKFSQLNVILNNGIKIENGCPNRMDPVSSHIEVEDIARIEVLKGPFTLRYGPSFGGVINLVAEEPRPYDKFEIHGSAMYGIESNWNGQKMHGTISGGNQKLYFLFSGGYRDYGDYESGDIEGEGLTYESSFNKFNYAAKVGWSPKPAHSYILSYDQMFGRDVRYPALPMDEKSEDTRIISLDYRGQFQRASIQSLEVKVYHSDVKHIMDNSRRKSYEIMQMVADVDATNKGGRAFLNLDFGGHGLLVGADYEEIRKDGRRTGKMYMMDTFSISVKNLWNQAVIQNIGLFTEYSKQISSFEINASARGDLNQATSEDSLRVVKDNLEYFGDTDSEYINFSLNIGVTKYFGSSLSLSLGLGSGTRSPDMLERYIKLLPVGFDKYDYLGNPKLKPETNNEIDLTLEYRKRETGSIYLNVFYSYVTNFISANLVPTSVITPQSQGVLGVKQFENVAYITSKGFEWGYQSPDHYKFGTNVTAAYTHAVIPTIKKYVMTGTQVTDEIQIINDALPEIPPLEARIKAYYKIMNGHMMPELLLRLVADQRHIAEAFYENETPGFALLDLTTKFKVNELIQLNAGISNIFNKAYYEHLNRRIIGTPNNLYEPGRVFFATAYLKI